MLFLALKDCLVLTGLGVACGTVLSLGVGRLVGSLLNGVSPFDPLTYAAVPLRLAAVALVASALPARRATRVDPIVALRCD